MSEITRSGTTSASRAHPAVAASKVLLEVMSPWADTREARASTRDTTGARAHRFSFAFVSTPSSLSNRIRASAYRDLLLLRRVRRSVTADAIRFSDPRSSPSLSRWLKVSNTASSRLESSSTAPGTMCSPNTWFSRNRCWAGSMPASMTVVLSMQAESSVVSRAVFRVSKMLSPANAASCFFTSCTWGLAASG